MARQVVEEPTLRKRKQRAVIGHTIIKHICTDCFEQIDEIAKPYVESEELREGDDAGVPYECFRCGKTLTADNGTQGGS